MCSILKGRKELKHEISKMDGVLLKKRLSYFMNTDPHSNGSGGYNVRSVYFDNFENKALIEKKEGYMNRAKYRVRTYNDDFDTINLEKKSKKNNLTYKEKCRMTAEEYELIRAGDILWMENDTRPLMRELFHNMVRYQLKPVTVVDYDRDVYIYPYGNVRLTFDSNIRTSLRNPDFLNTTMPMVPSLDHQLMILEVKYDEYIPDVIKMLLQMLDRRKGTYSKYQLSRMYGL